MTTSAVSSTTAMNTTNFTGPTGTATSFGSQQLSAPNHGASPHGRLESSPHDSVHGSIGGYMGSFGTAARDPIFWLHHCNIDRLWNVWLTMGGGRSDPKNSTWCNQVFQFFNENGTQVGIRVRDVINALAQLKYRYPGVAEVTQSCPTVLTPVPELSFDLTARTIKRIDQPITIRSQALRMRVPLAGQARQRSQEVASAPGQNLVLRIEGIKVDRQPGIIYEVYVGLPDGVRPDPNSRYFVGVLSTFGAEHAGAEGMTAAFPIDAAAAAALQANTNDVPVIIAPRGVVLNGQERLEVQGNVTFTSVRVVEE
jgi:tyrosinase